MLGVAALLLGAAVEPAAVGLYRTDQPEVAGALELQPGGRFRYALEYGAVSERGEGDWTSDGKALRLTSNPMPKQPAFELVRDDPAPKGELYMTLEDPGFSWGGPLDAVATVRGAAGKVVISADETGRVDLTPVGQVLSIEPLVPVYGQAGGVFPLSEDRGHRLRFKFRANDLGRAAFASEPLSFDGADLLLKRYETVIRFVRVSSETSGEE